VEFIIVYYWHMPRNGVMPFYVDLYYSLMNKASGGFITALPKAVKFMAAERNPVDHFSGSS
jgi:hypothetical protein